VTPNLFAPVVEILNELLGQIEEKPLPMAPFERDELLMWTVKNGLIEPLGDRWPRVEAALPPAEDLPEFFKAVIEGTVERVGEDVDNMLKLARAGVGYVIEYYRLVFDLEAWIQLLTVWFGRGDPRDVAAFLEREHNHLYTGIMHFLDFGVALEGFLNRLTDDTQFGSTRWTKGEAFAIDCIAQLVRTSGLMLATHADALVAAKGDATKQGQLIGREYGYVIIGSLIFAYRLYGIVEGAAKAAGRSALSTLRMQSKSQEIARFTQTMNAVDPDALLAGRRVATTQLEVNLLYERLARRIKAHRLMKGETAAFNKGGCHVYGYGRFDVDYISMQLDSHHIVEARHYDKFAADLRKHFGWNSSEDMDAIAIHTEWHIRSGRNMARDLAWVGAENELSLTADLTKFVNKRNPSTVRHLFEAHRDFYKDYSPRLFETLGPWFDAKLKLLP
jgi:hypothetical protein